MEVRGSMVKQGWVEKQSNYVSQWRRRWLVLTPQCLAAYRSENMRDKPAEHLPLAAITTLITDLESSKPFTFRINTTTQVFVISAANADSMTDWMQTIQFTMKHTRLPCKAPPADAQKLQKQFMENSLRPLQRILASRESELLTTLAQTQQDLVSQAQEEARYIDQVHDHLEEVYGVFLGVYDDPDMKSQEKLRKLRRLTQDVQRVSENPLGEVMIRSYVNLPLAATLLSQSIKISITNPSESHLRRTEITRALKWRYNGQRFDALTFTLSRAVELTAIGLCAPHKPNHVTTVLSLRVVAGGGFPSPQEPLYIHPHQELLTFRCDESVQKVALASKIPLAGGAKYSVIAQLEGASTYKCVLCRRHVPGDADWTFTTTVFTSAEENNRTDVECGPIADFYYLVRQ